MAVELRTVAARTVAAVSARVGIEDSLTGSRYTPDRTTTST
jgi:hypothetical protein